MVSISPSLLRWKGSNGEMCPVAVAGDSEAFLDGPDARVSPKEDIGAWWKCGGDKLTGKFSNSASYCDKRRAGNCGGGIASRLVKRCPVETSVAMSVLFLFELKDCSGACMLGDWKADGPACAAFKCWLVEEATDRLSRVILSRSAALP